MGLLAFRFIPGRAKGFTFLEAIIALTILLAVTLSIFSTMTVTGRLAETSKYEIYAVELLNRTAENLRATTYSNLGTAVGTAAVFLAPQLYTINPSTDGDTSRNINFTITCGFMGFGQVASASANSLTATIPGGWPAWTTNQWAGRMVMITGDPGSGQVASIISNTANTLTASYNLNGSGGSWIVTPTAASQFEIDHGKTVRITVAWTVRGLARSMTRTVLIPAPR